jgi:acyl carrier protein
VSQDGAEQVRLFVLDRVRVPLAAWGLTPETTPDDYDLLTSGVIDSFGMIELIGDLEQHFGVTLNFEEVPPEVVTVLGPLSQHVAGLLGQEPNG